MRYFIFIFVGFLFISCSKETTYKEKIQPEADEVVDIRIHSNGEVRINGSITSIIGLSSHIKSLNINKSTRARVILDENAPAGLVFKTQQLLNNKDISGIRVQILSSKEFKDYIQNKYHIDVLSSGKILFQGIRLYPKDLKIALNNIEINPSTKFILSVSEQAEVGPFFDTLEKLAAENMEKIIYEDMSKYYSL